MDLSQDSDEDYEYYKQLVLIASLSICLLIFFLFFLCIKICAQFKKFLGTRKNDSRDIEDGNGPRYNGPEDTTETKLKQNEQTIHEEETKKDDSGEGSKVKKIDTRSGFPNLGNTCYMNAILQNLVWTPSIRFILIKDMRNSAEIALFNLVEDVQNGSGGTVNRKFLLDLLKAARGHNNQFYGYRQQDSFEMYNTLVGGIQDEKLRNSKTDINSEVSDLEHTMNTCPLTRLFGGVFMTVYQYQSCGHVDLNFQMFTSICVPVPKEEKRTVGNPKRSKAEVKDQNTEEQMKGKQKHEVHNADKKNGKENVTDSSTHKEQIQEKNSEQLDGPRRHEGPNDRQEGNQENISSLLKNITSTSNNIDNEHAQEKPCSLNTKEIEEKQIIQENSNGPLVKVGNCGDKLGGKGNVHAPSKNKSQSEEKESSLKPVSENERQVQKKQNIQDKVNESVQNKAQSKVNVEVGEEIYSSSQNECQNRKDQRNVKNISKTEEQGHEKQEDEEKNTDVSRNERQSELEGQSEKEEHNSKRRINPKHITPEHVTSSSENIRNIDQTEQNTGILNALSVNDTRSGNEQYLQGDMHVDAAQEIEENATDRLKVGEDLIASRTKFQSVGDKFIPENISENEGQSEDQSEIGRMDELQSRPKKTSLEKKSENDRLHAENETVKVQCENKLDRPEHLEDASEEKEHNVKQKINQGLHEEKKKVHSKGKLDHLEEVPSEQKQRIAKQEGHQEQIEPLSDMISSSGNIGNIGKKEWNTRSLNASSETESQRGEEQETQRNINAPLEIGQQTDENKNIDVNALEDTEKQAKIKSKVGGDLTASGTECQRIENENIATNISENKGQREDKPRVGVVTGSRDENQSTQKKISLEETSENEELHSQNEKNKENSNILSTNKVQSGDKPDPSKQLKVPSEQVGQNVNQNVNQDQEQNEPLSGRFTSMTRNTGDIDQKEQIIGSLDANDKEIGEKPNIRESINILLEHGKQNDQGQNISVNASQETGEESKENPEIVGILNAAVADRTDSTDIMSSSERKEDKVCFKPLQEASTDKLLTGIELGLTELTDIEGFHDGIFSCTKCTTKDHDIDPSGKTTLKRLFVITPPPVLVLQINRFMQEWTGLRKIDKKVSFPEILNFSPYCSSAYKVTEQSPGNTNTDILYNLYGVVAHSGTLSGGHYVAYVKTERRDPENISKQIFKSGHFKDPERVHKEKILEFFKNKSKPEQVHNHADVESVQCAVNQTQDLHNEDKSIWYYISDSCVQKLDKQGVLNISNAYILFYERIE